MPDRKRSIPCLFVLVLLCGACSPSVSVQKIPAGEATASKAASPLPLEMSLFSSGDTELFNRALSYLAVPAGGQVSDDDYAKARSDFESLLNAYPKSKWRPASEECILLIDGITSQRQIGEKLLADKTRLAQENEQLKRQVRTLTEKLQTDTAALMQENEQLKKDIQKMKNLDIELEKRDRQLR